jgi:1-acyl-sn-glycerol-3-phosphate acyltransferase
VRARPLPRVMSDLAYNLVWCACYPAFRVSSRPVVLNRERADVPGAYILAPNHLSPYDVPCLMAASRRNLDFVGITESFRNPLVALLFRSVNVMPLDRSRVDGPAVRTLLDRLRRGRVVAMFPEGRIRTDERDSVIHGGPFKPGVARVAQLAGVPVVPAVVLGAAAYSRVLSWAPVRGVRYGVNFGRPLRVRPDLDKAEAVKQLLADMRQAYLDLYAELKVAMQ